MPLPYTSSGIRQASSMRQRHPGHRVRRLGDLLAASGLILLTLPLMLIVAIAIKCDSRGPIFLREERIDPRGRRFFAVKFRSTVYCECSVGALEDQLTFVGSVIRFLRIDNLPQLINVLRGEMTCIVGETDQVFFLE